MTITDYHVQIIILVHLQSFKKRKLIILCRNIALTWVSDSAASEKKSCSVFFQWDSNICMQYILLPHLRLINSVLWKWALKSHTYIYIYIFIWDREFFIFFLIVKEQWMSNNLCKKKKVFIELINETLIRFNR